MYPIQTGFVLTHLADSRFSTEVLKASNRSTRGAFMSKKGTKATSLTLGLGFRV